MKLYLGMNTDKYFSLISPVFPFVILKIIYELFDTNNNFKKDKTSSEYKPFNKHQQTYL